MTRDKRLLDTIFAISQISNDGQLGFEQKLAAILQEIVGCMETRRASIMLLKDRKAFEVVASTKPQLIGVRQPLDDESPSSWVLSNKSPLYVSKGSEGESLRNPEHEYEKEAYFIVPILSNKKVLGVLNVTEKIGADIFEKEEQEKILTVAGHIISALENQRLTTSLKKKGQTLQKKNSQLKRMEQLRTDLFNMLIHDLKGPISELFANLDILNYTLSDDNRQYVDSAQAAGDTLYELVSNVLDVARLEEGKLDFIYEKIDPQDLIKEIALRLSGLSKRKGLGFVEKFPSTRNGDFFWGDRGLLLRVMQNLWTNALQYSPSDGTIEVGYNFSKPQKIEFFVQDQGPGIPSEHQEAIFDKFTQLEKRTSDRMYSTGMGLSFCRMAVEAHKGKIGVTSETGVEGSCFWFTLPLEARKRTGSNR